MKNILNAPFLLEMTRALSNMYRLGWDERNGGNVSVILDEKEVGQYLNLNKVIRNIPMGFQSKDMVGKILLVTGTGKYFKNAERDPETNLGIVRIAQDGQTAELLWGYKDGGQFTSEFPAHLMSHSVRLKKDPKHRVIMHCHPTKLLAMTFVEKLDDKTFTLDLWRTCSECIVVFPDGVGVLPWMCCGTTAIGEATAKKMEEYRLVVWGLHGLYGSGRDLDEAFGLIETVEKAAELYMLTAGLKVINLITNEQLLELVKRYDLKYRKEFID